MSTKRFIGTSPLRREDHRLLTGNGEFTGDVARPDALHISFVRSPAPMGKIRGRDLDAAREMSGVVAVVAAQDLPKMGALSVNKVLPLETRPDYPILTDGEVLFVGQAMVATLAESKQQADDACEAVWVEIDEEDTEPLAETIAQKRWQQGDVAVAFAAAEYVVSARIDHPRLAPSPLETRGIAVEYHSLTNSVTITYSSQTPHRARNELVQILGVEANRIRVIAPDVGGAFGMKASLYPEEVFAVWAAFHFKRSTLWIASRSEDFLSATHGRGGNSHAELAVSKAGKFLGLRAEIDNVLGAWLPNSGLIPTWNAARVLPGGYAVASVDISTKASLSNTAPIGIYRGAGRPEAALLMERLVTKAAAIAGFDPIAIRRLNLLRAHDLPHETATGNRLDSGDYDGLLQQLEVVAGYHEMLAQRDARCDAGELVGVGVSFYLEPSGRGWESAAVTVEANGQASVKSGGSSQGHGRETAFAQIAADALGLEMNTVTVTFGDTETCPEGIGALASRSTPIGGSAVLAACRQIRSRMAAGETAPVTANVRYTNDGEAWGYGAYLVQVAIDPDTGALTIEKAICVDDAGLLVNPKLVEGQIRGGFAQGVGEATMEALVYDADTQLITGSFMDYAMPRADDMPPLHIHKIETASPFNILGAKGVGEAGTIGAPPAIVNATIDALVDFGVRDLDMPLTSEKLWHAMQEGR